MNPLPDHRSDVRYRACRLVLGDEAWGRLSAQCDKALAEYSLSSALVSMHERGFPEFLCELARLEETAAAVERAKSSLPREISRPLVNPTIQIIELSWKNLASLLDPDQKIS